MYETYPNSLSDRERDVIDELPATAAELAESFGISQSTVRDHISRARTCGLDVEYNTSSKAYYLPEPNSRVQAPTPADKSAHRGEVSRRKVTTTLRDINAEIESCIVNRLKSRGPMDSRPPLYVPGGEDILLHVSDVHMGDVVTSDELEENRHGELVPVEVYNPEITERSFEHVTNETLRAADRMGGAHKFDAIHCLYGGDFVTGEVVYDSQPHDIRETIVGQMSRASAMMVQQIKAFSKAFDHVQVICQPGNHGEVKASGTSSNANFDRAAYFWARDVIQESDVDNVSMRVEGGEYYRNFEMRGGEIKGHLRHGHQSPKHIEATRMSESKWRGWWMKHRFDTAYLGHYHNSRRAFVTNQYPVTMAPSMKPGSDYAEKIGSPDCSEHRKLATLHGVSDDNPITWEYSITDTDMSG